MANCVNASCRDCFFYHSTGWVPSCDYYEFTGKRRPCSAGEGCTVKCTTKKKAKQLTGTLSYGTGRKRRGKRRV